MKKEAGMIFQDIEKKYNLNKYKKTEYLKRMVKEFAKFDKKLVKIENYEKMEKEGKILNEEMKELISKKKGFQNHIDSLKTALDIYHQSLTVEDEPLTKIPPTDSQKDIKAEVDKQVKEFKRDMVTRLSYFFAFGRTLAEKSNLTVNPFARMSEERRNIVSGMFKAFTTLPRSQMTSLAEEARKTGNAIKQLLRSNDPSSFISALAGENELTQMTFTLTSPRENEYETTQPVSILKDEVKERQPEPVAGEIPKVQKEPTTESSKPTKEIEKEIYHEPEPEKQQEIKESWAQNDVDSDKEEHQEDEQEEQQDEDTKEDEFEFPKQVVEEEEFQTMLSKSEARKARDEEQRGGRRGRYGGRKFRGNREEGYKKNEGSKKKEEEYKKEGEYKKETHEETHWGEEGGNYRGGYRGTYQPRRRGYYRGRRGDYGDDYRGGRRYAQARSNY